MTDATRSSRRIVTENPIRLRLAIRGTVQGVGFRPFVYRLAEELGLFGWVNNSPQGVSIEVEGKHSVLERFLLQLTKDLPAQAFIQSLESTFLDPKGYTHFEIRESETRGDKTTLVTADIATCPDCLYEIFTPSNRRYRYPFTNCTHCGPRFSIIAGLPYDRSNTTMKDFPLCEACLAEYQNPRDRRFHAEANACPDCGPHLEFWNAEGKKLSTHNDALLQAAETIKNGSIIAVKGLGGFHFMTDARNADSILRLRLFKNRDEKPFALMYPQLDLIKKHCEVSPIEERILTSAESPIVLLKRRLLSETFTDHTVPHKISHSVAPGNPYLGIMLPYTPLHHLLMAELNFPVVATSGNLADEPICIDEYDALDRLKGIAEYFLIHNRPIIRHVDDSIVRMVMGRELVLRRARGYAPLPISLPQPLPNILAVGAHLKNTIAASIGRNVFISQHIGDLETPQAYEAFKSVLGSFQQLYNIDPQAIACDVHPDYLSTQFAHTNKLPIVQIQHHYAHILSCMAENELESPVLGVAWDGTGYGLDDTLWGGEFLKIEGKTFQRMVNLMPFQLPGGESAIKEPRRSAIGVLYKVYGEDVLEMRDLPLVRSFSAPELEILRTMLRKKVNSYLTSSAGRLFDAVASIVNLRQITHFEGQAAMELEFSIAEPASDDTYLFQIVPNGSVHVSNEKTSAWLVDWKSMFLEITEDVLNRVPVSEISAKFHNTLVEMIVETARKIGENRVVLSGGCFQNRYLIERTVRRLNEEGFRPYWHQRVPPNDGGIALGQIIGAARHLKESPKCA